MYLTAISCATKVCIMQFFVNVQEQVWDIQNCWFCSHLCEHQSERTRKGHPKGSNTIKLAYPSLASWKKLQMWPHKVFSNVSHVRSMSSKYSLQNVITTSSQVNCSSWKVLQKRIYEKTDSHILTFFWLRCYYYYYNFFYLGGEVWNWLKDFPKAQRTMNMKVLKEKHK